MSPQGTDELLTVAETAARLRLKPGTIYNWISQQHLTSADGVVRIGGKAVRVVWDRFYARMVEGAA